MPRLRLLMLVIICCAAIAAALGHNFANAAQPTEAVRLDLLAVFGPAIALFLLMEARTTAPLWEKLAALAVPIAYLAILALDIEMLFSAQKLPVTRLAIAAIIAFGVCIVFLASLGTLFHRRAYRRFKP